MYQKVIRCVRLMSGVSERHQVCQKVVRRMSGMSEGHQVCKKLIRCVRRSSGLSKEGYQVSQ